MSLFTICHDTQDISNNIDAIKKEAHRKAALRFAFSENESGVECAEQDLSSLGTSSILHYVPAQEKQKKNEMIPVSMISDFQDNNNTGSEFEGFFSEKKIIHPSLFVTDLGWTREEAIEARMRLTSFEDDWDAPGMELYDKL